MWEKCIPKELYKYICLGDNFILLNQLEVAYQKANTFVKNFIKKNSKGMQLLQDIFKNYWLIFQYVYAIIFRKCYYFNKKFGVIKK